MKKEIKNIQVQKTANSTFMEKSIVTHSQFSLNQIPLEHEIAENVYVLNTDRESILDIFQQAASQLQFTLIERQDYYSTVIKHQKKNPFTFFKCFNVCSPQQVTAVKIVIQSKGDFNNKNLCRLKGLVGSQFLINQFFNVFSQKTQLLTSNQIFIFGQDSKEVKQQPSNPFQIQACAMFTFQQLLSNETTEAYKILSKEIQDFHQSFKNIQESVDLLPMPMKNIITMANEVYQILERKFSQDIHYQKIMPYCKVSVERYIFDKIQNLLMKIYNKRNQSFENIYQKKKNLIFQRLNLKQIYQQVSVCKKMQFVDQKQLDNKFTSQKLCQLLGFEVACEQIAKIKYTSNPRQKIKFVQLAYTRLKSMVYQKSNKKLELATMQDVIPMMILLILFVKVDNFRTQLDLMKDFIDFDIGQMQSQKRVIVNLSESFNYIVRDWKIEQQSK